MMNKILYYVLSATWGFIMTFIGLLITLILLMLCYKPHKNIYGWYFEIGENWGGVNLGLCTLTSRNPSEHVLTHEFGHSVQSCIFGPMYIFIVAIPSVVRYWYREYLIQVKHRDNLPEYDSIWFEGQATRLGQMYK